jgi:hypothetical protein
LSSNLGLIWRGTPPNSMFLIVRVAFRPKVLSLRNAVKYIESVESDVETHATFLEEGETDVLSCS